MVSGQAPSAGEQPVDRQRQRPFRLELPARQRRRVLRRRLGSVAREDEYGRIRAFSVRVIAARTAGRAAGTRRCASAVRSNVKSSARSRWSGQPRLHDDERIGRNSLARDGERAVRLRSRRFQPHDGHVRGARRDRARPRAHADESPQWPRAGGKQQRRHRYQRQRSSTGMSRRSTPGSSGLSRADSTYATDETSSSVRHQRDPEVAFACQPGRRRCTRGPRRAG